MIESILHTTGEIISQIEQLALRLALLVLFLVGLAEVVQHQVRGFSDDRYRRESDNARRKHRRN